MLGINQCIVILFIIASLVTVFFSALAAWIILAVPIVCLLLIRLSVKRKKFKHFQELSDGANRMLQKYGPYYLWPYAGKDFSTATSLLTLSAIVVAIIGAIRGYWWGIAWGSIVLVITIPMARAFNPSHFITDELEGAAHNEVIDFIQQREKQFLDQCSGKTSETFTEDEQETAEKDTGQ